MTARIRRTPTGTEVNGRFSAPVCHGGPDWSAHLVVYRRTDNGTMWTLMLAAADPYNRYTTDPLWLSIWTLCPLLAIGLFFLLRLVLRRRIAASNDAASWLARLGRIDTTSTPRKASRRLFCAAAVVAVLLIFGGRQPHLRDAAVLVALGGVIAVVELSHAMRSEPAG